VSESVGSRSVTLGISFISGSAGELMPHVNASTVDGTATGKYFINIIIIIYNTVLQFAGSGEADYGSIANLSISFTSASNRISIQIVQDVFTEINETFSVVLSSVFLTRSTGGAIIDLSDQERARLILIPNITTVIILDDDGNDYYTCKML
jgi:hypothetical protein